MTDRDGFQADARPRRSGWWRVRAGALVVAFAACTMVALAGLGRSPVPPPLVVPPPGPPANGIDTSSFQHPHGARIDWSGVRASGVSFVYVKATEGSQLVDPWFARDWAAVARAGLYRGAYHYARPAAGTAVGDADRFLDVVGSLNHPGDLPPALDVEDAGGLDPGALADWIGSWLDEATRRTGRVPVVYTRAAFWTAQVGNTDRFASSPLWVARYTTDAEPGPSFGGWPTWTLWQWTSTGATLGVRTAVDQDRLAGGGPALVTLAAARVTPAP